MDISKASQQSKGWWKQLKEKEGTLHIKHSKYFKIPKDMDAFYVEYFKRELASKTNAESFTLDGRILVWIYVPSMTNPTKIIDNIWLLVCAKNRETVSQNKIKKYQQRIWK
jgi:hypothetical protein